MIYIKFYQILSKIKIICLNVRVMKIYQMKIMHLNVLVEIQQTTESRMLIKSMLT